MVARAKRNSAGSSHISMMLSFLFLYGMIDTVTSIPIFLGRGGVVTDSTIHDLQKTTALGNCFHELATEPLWDTILLQYDFPPPLDVMYLIIMSFLWRPTSFGLRSCRTFTWPMAKPSTNWQRSLFGLSPCCNTIPQLRSPSSIFNGLHL